MVLLASCAVSVSAQDAGQGACTYDGASYEEGRRVEGVSADQLCLPSGGCPQATVVVPVFRCSAGKWECVSNCRTVDGAPGKPAMPAAGGKRAAGSRKDEKKPAGGQGGQGSGCQYEGNTYPVGKRTEGNSVKSLCLPKGGCPQATAVLPVFECSASRQWRCTQNCWTVGGADTAAGNAAQRGQLPDKAGGNPGAKPGGKQGFQRPGLDKAYGGDRKTGWDKKSGGDKETGHDGFRRTGGEDERGAGGTEGEDADPRVRGTETAGDERAGGGKDPATRAAYKRRSAGNTGKAGWEINVPKVGGGKPVAGGKTQSPARAPGANERKQLNPGGFTNLREKGGAQTGGNPSGTVVDPAGTVKR